MRFVVSSLVPAALAVFHAIGIVLDDDPI